MFNSTILRIIVAIAIIVGGALVIMNESPTTPTDNIDNIRPSPAQGKP